MEKWDNTPAPSETAPPSIEETWANLAYFLEKVMPVAEEAGVLLAMHPDDPPIAVLRGYNRIMNTEEDFARLLSINSSRNNGLCLDVSLWGLMGANVPEAIRRHGDRIHFVHFRDVEGTREKYTEVFHDEGMSDHVEASQTPYVAAHERHPS